MANVVNNVRHLFTEWEENPDKMILRSKSSVTLLALTPSQDQLAADTSKLFFPDSEGEGNAESVADGNKEVESIAMHADSGFISVPASSSDGSGLDDNAFSGDDPPCIATHAGRRCHKPRAAADKASNYSPEQLQTIQARVKDSLKNQGVYLYDPVTGAGIYTSSMHWSRSGGMSHARGAKLLNKL